MLLLLLLLEPHLKPLSKNLDISSSSWELELPAGNTSALGGESFDFSRTVYIQVTNFD
jgi:hypothetical protein